MFNLTFLFETYGKTEIQFIQLREDKVSQCLLRIEEGFGTSLESGQPAHPCSLTRIYTVGCSNSYFDLDIPKIYNGLFENLIKTFFLITIY